MPIQPGSADTLSQNTVAPGSDARPFIQAREIVTQITRTGAAPLFSLTDTQVEGDLNLRYYSVTVAVEIKNCLFHGRVDLRSADFARAVSFTDCTFAQDFNSGDDEASHTVYQTDLNCCGTTFCGLVSFKNVQIGGSGLFRRARFLFVSPENAAEGGDCAKFDADFSGGAVGKSLEFDDAVFHGNVNLNAVSCDLGGSLQGTRFENEHCAVDLIGSTFGKALQCSRSVFQGGLRMDNCGCGLQCHFPNARFGKQADFKYGKYGTQLSCEGAVFEAGASFAGIECKDVLFIGAEFRSREQPVDLSFASIDGSLNCHQTIFRGDAYFTGLECKNVFFDFAHAVGTINLESAQIAQDLWLGGAMLEGEVTLRNASVRRIVFDQADPALTGAGGLLVTADPTRLTEARASGQAPPVQAVLLKDKLRFFEACRKVSPEDPQTVQAEGRFLLTEAGVVIIPPSTSPSATPALLVLDTAKPAAGEGGFVSVRGGALGEGRLDFSRCTFDAVEFWATPHFFTPSAAEIADRLRRWQPVASLNMDPYLQMEKYYLNIGDEEEADHIFYCGCCHRRRNALRNAKWSLWKSVGDWFLRVTTGYGVKSWLMAIPIAAFLAVGTLVFFPTNAVEAKKSTTAAVLAYEENTKALADDRAHPWQRLFHRLEYSADLFIPGDIFHVGDSWQPKPLWRETYADVQVVAGWVLVPLLVASFAGLIRVNRRE